MAVTLTLVEQGSNRLRYLVNSNATGNTTASLTTTGAATPDLLTDSTFVGPGPSPIRAIALAFTGGIGILAAGAFTQAQARAMWMADNSDTVLGNNKVPRALPRVTPRTGVAVWLVDANVDGAGHPVINITASDIGTAYLDIETQGAIGI